MEQQELYNLAVQFRHAIMEAKWNREFHSGADRMNNFPGGCCDDSADLFGYYLWSEYQIQSKQGNGVYRDDDPENTTNHAFTILGDGMIVDLTADQFWYFSDSSDGIYVGPEIDFYSHLEEKNTYEHCDITCNKRLRHDYEAIRRHL